MVTLRKTGDVHICKITTIENKEICVKFLSDKDINYGSTDINFANTINRLNSCIKTKNIFLLSDYYSPYTHLIETEYANLGSLYTFLLTKPKKNLVWALLFETIKALRILHNKGILHNDIKPSNILVTLENNRHSIRLNDFNIINDKKVCTPEYASPEIIQKNIYSVQSDIWAIGVVIYELFLRKFPFGSRIEKLSPNDIFKNVLENEPTDISSIPPPFDAIVRNCLIKDIARRPSTINDLIHMTKIKLNAYNRAL